MKKAILFLIFLLIISITPAFAGCEYSDRCAKSPHKNDSNPAKFLADKTGANAFIESFAENLIQSELKKMTNQNFQVDMKIFGLQETLDGQFKSLILTGDNVVVEGFHLSKLKVQTICDFNHVNLSTKPISLKENMVLEVTAEISASDFRNTMANSYYSKAVEKINLREVGISAFKIYTPTINISNGKIYFTINAVPNGSYPPMDISIGADLKAKEGNIVSSKIDFINLYTGFDLTQLSSFLSSLNNLRYQVKLLGDKYSEIHVQDVNIIGDKAYLKAIVFIPKTSK